MNKTILFLSAILLTLSLASCSEKEPLPEQPIDTTSSTNDTLPSQPEIDYAQAILGHWNAQLSQCYERYTENNTYEEITYASEWATDLSLTFKTDGLLTYSATVGGYPDSWDDAYTVQSDTLFWDAKPYKILILDSTHLVFEFSHDEQRTTSGGSTITTNVTKHWELAR